MVLGLGNAYSHDLAQKGDTAKFNVLTFIVNCITIVLVCALYSLVRGKRKKKTCTKYTRHVLNHACAVVSAGNLQTYIVT